MGMEVSRLEGLDLELLALEIVPLVYRAVPELEVLVKVPSSPAKPRRSRSKGSPWSGKSSSMLEEVLAIESITLSW